MLAKHVGLHLFISRHFSFVKLLLVKLVSSASFKHLALKLPKPLLLILKYYFKTGAVSKQSQCNNVIEREHDLSLPQLSVDGKVNIIFSSKARASLLRF